jgi:hypothetical protein
MQLKKATFNSKVKVRNCTDVAGRMYRKREMCAIGKEA